MGLKSQKQLTRELKRIRNRQNPHLNNERIQKKKTRIRNKFWKVSKKEKKE